MDRKTMYQQLDMESLYDQVEKNLKPSRRRRSRLCRRPRCDP